MAVLAIAPPQQEAATAAPAPAQRMTLAAMTEEFQCLLDTAEMVTEGSSDMAELEARIKEFEAALPAKVDAVVRALAFLNSQAALEKAEAKRIADRQRRYERDAERLENYIVRVLNGLPEPAKGSKKLEGNHATLSLRPSEAVAVRDEAAIPAAYKKAAIELPAVLFEKLVAAFPDLPQQLTKQTLELRKDDLKRALKAGAEISGADIEYRSNLRVS